MEISSVQLHAHESSLDQIKNDLHELREQYLALTEGMSGHEFARKPYLKEISTLMFHLEKLLEQAQSNKEAFLIWEKSRTSYYASKQHIQNVLASPLNDGATVVILQ
jgi:chromosome segregation ATPase